MVAVVSMFSTILVAVPALSRVDPLSTSGPTTGVIISWLTCSNWESRLQLNPIVNVADLPRVVQAADHVRRAAARGNAHQHIARVQAAVLQVPHGALRLIFRALDGRGECAGAAGDDAHHQAGGVLNVGGHSDASSTPSRPDVPAPR